MFGKDRKLIWGWAKYQDVYSRYLQVGVRIQNKDGYGELGKLVKSKTLPDRPGSAPRLFTAEDVGAMSAELSWLPPGLPNGRIGEYRVKWGYYDTKDKLVDKGEAIVNATHFRLANLTSYTR